MTGCRQILGFLQVTCCILIFLSCEETYTPKPRAYPRTVLPGKHYRPFTAPCCPFTFSYPDYASVQTNLRYFDTLPEHPCWFNISFDTLDARIHFSYKPVSPLRPLEKLLSDSRMLTFRHAVKAEYIDEAPVARPGRVYGMLYDVGGNAASAIQFFLTDSEHHFLRGALYFNATPNADSLRPAVEFIRADIEKLINTFAWTASAAPDTCHPGRQP